MIIRRFTFTILTFIFLLCALYAEGMILAPASVSPETVPSAERYTVKQGVSQDGQVTIVRAINAPQIPPREKASNKPRTLRAFIGANSVGVPTLFVESVKPHEYYTVTGAFSMVPAYSTLMWMNSNTLVFYVLTNEGVLMCAQLDVLNLSLLILPVSVAQISTSTTPFDLESIL